MANTISFNVNTLGDCTIDYDSEKIVFNRKGSEAKLYEFQDMEIPFSDITGIEIRKPSFTSLGRVHFILKGKRIASKVVVDSKGNKDLNKALKYDVTQFYTKNKLFSDFENAIKALASSRNIPIGNEGSISAEICTYDEYNNVEYRMLCNVCGKVFCYSSLDLIRNQNLKEEANKKEASAALKNLFTSQIMATQDNAEAISLRSGIKDYSKCPHCGSTDLKELTKEEFEQHKAQANNPNPNSGNVSVADELKKFKELLDMGVITQEEFDAKKKQLLGL